MRADSACCSASTLVEQNLPGGGQRTIADSWPRNGVAPASAARRCLRRIAEPGMSTSAPSVRETWSTSSRLVLRPGADPLQRLADVLVRLTPAGGSPRSQAEIGPQAGERRSGYAVLAKDTSDRDPHLHHAALA